MRPAYDGNARPFVLVLAAPADRDRLAETLEALDAAGAQQGFDLCGPGGKLGSSQARRARATVAFLSEATAVDQDLQQLLFETDAAGVTLIPVRLDGAPQGEAVERLLFARNAIMSDRYPTAQELASRICTADDLRKPKVTQAQKAAQKKTSRGLLAGALVAVLVAGLLIWQAVSKVPETAEPAPDTDLTAYGLDQVNLEDILEVLIVGDHFMYFTNREIQSGGGNYPGINAYASSTWDDDGPHWFWNEDGSELAEATYDNLDFLTLMPNLHNLSIARADVTAIPDLSSLEHLSDVVLNGCTVGSIDWIAGSPITHFDASDCDVSDFSALTSCANLYDVTINTDDQADLASIAPPALQRLRIDGSGEGDLSGLASCGQLSELELRNLSLSDLSFLEGNTSLTSLSVGEMDELADVGALGSCENLERVDLDNTGAVSDLSFLNDLDKLQEVHLFGVPIQDFGFLANVSASKFNLGFASSAETTDYSGLALVDHYDWMHVNIGNRDFSQIAPYLQDATVNHLELWDCDDVDLSALPHIRDSLRIHGSDLTSLEGFSQDDINRLQLDNLQYLTTLDGLGGITNLDSKMGLLELEVTGCPRLSDWSALEGKTLAGLLLIGAYTLPDFTTFEVIDTLHLESLEGLDDLTAVAQCATNVGNFELVGIDDWIDLSPLYDIDGGGVLQVDPQLEDQAKGLVNKGVFKSYEITYPEGGWESFDMEATLLSLDEIETLPESYVSRIGLLEIAGGEVLQPGEWAEDRGQGEVRLVAVNEAGEERDLGQGTFTDFSVLEPLTGLRGLRLEGQPLTSLEGIQNLASLEELQVNWCRDLTDITAAFATPTLRRLDMLGCVTDIQGIQNLTELEEVTLSWNESLTDLTPLVECPGLKKVRVSSTMEEAIESLKGADYDFELEIEEPGGWSEDESEGPEG